jgi:hypothetical protein
MSQSANTSDREHPQHTQKAGYMDRLAANYLSNRKPVGNDADEPYLLNETEISVIRKTRREILIIAAVLGVLGVLFLYLPQYFFPTLFPDTIIHLFGKPYAFPIITSVYGIILVFAEIYALTFFNLRAVRIISGVCQFPYKQDPEYDKHIRALASAALEKEDKDILLFGINPYFGLPKLSYTLFFILNKLKATLSNVLLKILIKRVLGRFALREITDLAGIPIYAFWNAWASHLVIKEATIRIMAPLTIRQFVTNLHKRYDTNPSFKEMIVETLQFIAILKRRFNYSHFLLTEELFRQFAIEKETPAGDFLQKITDCSPEVRHGLQQLIVFGVLIDGSLSRAEKKRLQLLEEKGLLPMSMDAIVQLEKDYVQGRGLRVS